MQNSLNTAYSELPVKVSAPASVPYGNTFLLVGGDGDHIFKFLPETEEWELMPGKLSVSKFGVTAMLIRPEDLGASDIGIAEHLA